MLRTAWFVARTDTRHTLREKETLAWLFVMPLVFMYFIGSASGGFGGRRTQKDALTLVAPPDAGLLAERVAARLAENDYEVARAASAAEAAGATRALELPAGFTERVLAGEDAKVVLTRESGGLGADYDRVRVGRAVYTTLADVIAAAHDGAPSEASLAAIDALPRALTLEVAPAGERRVIPTGFEQAVPGILVMFTLIALLTSGAVLLVIERRAGLLRRLACTPLPRGGIVLGKWGGKMILGLVQIAFAMLAGSLLFGVRWGTNLPMVAVVLLAWGAFCASAGLLLGSIARTEGQAVGIGVLATNVLAALGGCWWPIEIAPDWMQSVAKLLPTGWAMDALHRLVSFHAEPTSALPHVLALVASAAALAALGKRCFRFA